MISIIIPCRNERAYIGRALDSLLVQQGVPSVVEILIADGMSDDGTRDILADYQGGYDCIRVFDNPGKSTPAALKLLLEHARGDYIVRADSHCEYPPTYLETLTSYLENTDAVNVGGIWDTVAGSDSLVAQVIADAMSSVFGVGMSYRTRTGKEPVEVETVPFGAWRKDFFEKYGPFDQKFLRAQDLEHNIRVKKAGGKILCLPWLKIRYFARTSFRKLWGMSLQYGYWKIPVMKKHRTRFSMRQFLPALLVLALTAGLVGAPFAPMVLLPTVIYLLASFLVSLRLSILGGRFYSLPFFMLAFGLMHIGYGIGYLRGILDVALGRFGGLSESSRG